MERWRETRWIFNSWFLFVLESEIGTACFGALNWTVEQGSCLALPRNFEFDNEGQKTLRTSEQIETVQSRSS